VNLMLLVIFLSLGIGVTARRFGRAQRLGILGLVVFMTGLYTFLGYRFV
jgi:hypothetical protein